MAITANSARAYHGLQANAEPTSEGTTGTLTIGQGSTVTTLANATEAIVLAVEVDSTYNVTIPLDTLIPVLTGAGVNQVETATAAGTITASGNATVIVTGDDITGSPLTVSVAVLNADTASAWAQKVRTALGAVSVAGVVTISAANTGEYGNAITLTEAATNTTVSGSGTLTGGIDKVVITGDGVDALGNAIPTCSAIHGVQVTCTSGSVTAAISTIVKDTVSISNGFQTWSVPGRTDLLENLVITSAAVNTVAKVIVRARD